jgi:hypothetical protein
MWPIIAGLTVVLAQAVQPGPGSKGHEWCFERGQGAQLCEATEVACNRLRDINTEIAQSPCRPVEPPEIQQSPTKPPAPPNPADANATIDIGFHTLCWSGNALGPALHEIRQEGTR